MSTWDDKPNDYEHALAMLERLRAALRTAYDQMVRDRYESAKTTVAKALDQKD